MPATITNIETEIDNNIAIILIFEMYDILNDQIYSLFNPDKLALVMFINNKLFIKKRLNLSGNLLKGWRDLKAELRS